MSVNLRKVFKALADESRRAVLDRLYAKGGQTQTELYEPFAKAMSRQALMKHLAVLEDANLVTIIWMWTREEALPQPYPHLRDAGSLDTEV